MKRRGPEAREGRLSPQEIEGVAAHLSRCPDCRAEAAFEKSLAADLAALRRMRAPEIDVRARVLREIASGPLPGRSPAPLRTLGWAAAALAVVVGGAAFTASSWAPGLAAGVARALGGGLAGAAGSVAPATELATVLFGAARATVRALLPGPRLLGAAALLLHGTALFAGTAAIAASAAIAGRDLLGSRTGTR